MNGDLSPPDGLHPASVHDGERVGTGDTIGRVGGQAYAQTVGCMLTFEVWRRGCQRHGPADPLRILKRWGSWS